MTINLMSLLSDNLDACQQGESIFNDKGLIVNAQITHEYYNIYCLLNGKGRKIQQIYYPFLFFSSPRQLMDIAKIGLLAEKKGLKYLDLGITMPDKQKWIISYLDENIKANALLLAYLKTLNLKPKNFQERLTYNWLKNDLMGTPTKTSIGIYKFNYYQRDGFTPEMKRAYQKKYGYMGQNNKQKNTTDNNIIEELKQKYQFVKDYDNFTDFKKKLSVAKKDGITLKKKLLADPDFIKFKETIPVKKFKFPLKEAKNTGVLDRKMLREVDQFQKGLKNSNVNI